MTHKDARQDNAQTKAQPKKRQPVKKHDPQADRIASTLVIVGCVGAAASAVLMYFHLDTPLVWVSFGTVMAFLTAIYFHWRNPSVQALCTSLGVLLFIGCLIWQYEISVGRIDKPMPASPPNGVLVPAAQPTVSPLPSPSAREVLDVEPETLLAFFKKYNSAQAQKLVDAYIGKWVRFTGEVADVFPGETSGGRWPDPGPSVMMRIKRSSSGSFTAFCDFEEQRWRDRAAVLRAEEKVTVFGQITRITDGFFVLKKCEFVK